MQSLTQLCTFNNTFQNTVTSFGGMGRCSKYLGLFRTFSYKGYPTRTFIWPQLFLTWFRKPPEPPANAMARPGKGLEGSCSSQRRGQNTNLRNALGSDFVTVGFSSLFPLSSVTTLIILITRVHNRALYHTSGIVCKVHLVTWGVTQLHWLFPCGHYQYHTLLRQLPISVLLSGDGDTSTLWAWRSKLGFNLQSDWTASTCTVPVVAGRPSCPLPVQLLQKTEDYTVARATRRETQICAKIREAIPHQLCSFFKHCLNGLWPPPLVLNMFVANFFERLLKKCVNACHDKIRQNNA